MNLIRSILYVYLRYSLGVIESSGVVLREATRTPLAGLSERCASRS